MQPRRFAQLLPDVRLYDAGFVAWQANGAREVRDLSDDMGGVIGG